MVKALSSVTLDSLVLGGSISETDACMLKGALKCKENIFISGASCSGKSTLLQAMMEELNTTKPVMIMEKRPNVALAGVNIGYITPEEEHRLEENINFLDYIVTDTDELLPKRIVQKANTGRDIGLVATVYASDLMEAVNKLVKLRLPYYLIVHIDKGYRGEKRVRVYRSSFLVVN